MPWKNIIKKLNSVSGKIKFVNNNAMSTNIKFINGSKKLAFIRAFIEVKPV